MANCSRRSGAHDLRYRPATRSYQAAGRDVTKRLTGASQRVNLNWASSVVVPTAMVPQASAAQAAETPAAGTSQSVPPAGPKTLLFVSGDRSTCGPAERRQKLRAFERRRGSRVGKELPAGTTGR